MTTFGVRCARFSFLQCPYAVPLRSMQAGSSTFTPTQGGCGCFVASLRPDRSNMAPRSGLALECAAQVAARPARTKLRRRCAANRLNHLGSLTYGEARGARIPIWSGRMPGCSSRNCTRASAANRCLVPGCRNCTRTRVRREVVVDVLVSDVPATSWASAQ